MWCWLPMQLIWFLWCELPMQLIWFYFLTLCLTPMWCWRPIQVDLKSCCTAACKVARSSYLTSITLYIPIVRKMQKKNYTHLHSRMNAEWSQGNDPSTKTVISSLETLSRVILYTLKRFLRTNYFPHSFEIELSNLLVKIMCKVKGGFDGTFFFVWIFSAALGYMLTCYLMDRMPIAG